MLLSALSLPHPLPALFVGFVGSSRGSSWKFLLVMLISFPFLMLFTASSGTSNRRKKELTRALGKRGFTPSETNLLACFPYTMNGAEQPLAVSGTRGPTDLLIIESQSGDVTISSTVALRGLDTAAFLASFGKRSQHTSTVKDWLVYTPGCAMTTADLETLIAAVP